MQALLKGYRTAFARETRVYDEKPLHFLLSCRPAPALGPGTDHVAFRYAPALLGSTRRQPAQVEAGCACCSFITPPAPCWDFWGRFSSNSAPVRLALSKVSIWAPFFRRPYLLPPDHVPGQSAETLHFLPALPAFLRYLASAHFCRPFQPARSQVALHPSQQGHRPPRTGMPQFLPPASFLPPPGRSTGARRLNHRQGRSDLLKLP